MFVKVLEFHWQGLVGPAIAVIGIALLIVAGSIYLYSRSVRGEQEEEHRVEMEKLNRTVIFGLMLIGVGIIGFAVIGGGQQILTERHGFAAPAETDIGRIFYQPAGEELFIPLTELIRKSNFTVTKDEIQMKSDGYIETPFVFLGNGTSFLEFEAAGAAVENEQSKILTGILVLERDGTSLSGELVMRELTPEKKKYSINLTMVANKIVAVRIEFINATNKDKKPVRIVTISNVAFKRQ